LPVDIYEGAVDGDSIRFKCMSLDGDRIVSLVGKVSGDQITFAWQKEVRDGGNSLPARPTLVPRDENAWVMFGEATPGQFTATRVAEGGAEFAAAFNLPQLDLKVEGTIFVPPNVRQVRAIVVLLNSGVSWEGMGGSLYSDPELRRLVQRLECALLLPRFTTIRRESDPTWILTNARLGAADGLFMILERLALESNHAEITDAPLLLWAHSRTGHLGATFAALHPQRTVALVRYHTGGGGLGGPDMKVLTQIPSLLVEARSDIEQNKTNGFRGEAAETTFKAGRAAGAPWTFAIEPDAVHQNPANLKTANALVLPWIAGVLRQRLSVRAPELRAVTETSAWLGDIQTGRAGPSADFVGPKQDANWLPDDESAHGWRRVTGMKQ
jgi:hypothetical protein